MIVKEEGFSLRYDDFADSMHDSLTVMIAVALLTRKQGTLNRVRVMDREMARKDKFEFLLEPPATYVVRKPKAILRASKGELADQS